MLPRAAPSQRCGATARRAELTINLRVIFGNCMLSTAAGVHNRLLHNDLID